MNNLKKILIDYCKSEGKKLRDIKNELLDLALDTEDLDSNDYDFEDQRHKDLLEFHSKIVKDLIEFISGNPGIKEMIEAKRKEISEKIKGYTPDLRVSFDVDGLDDSLEFGEWVPSTDSSLGIYLGNVNVIFSA